MREPKDVFLLRRSENLVESVIEHDSGMWASPQKDDTTKGKHITSVSVTATGGGNFATVMLVSLVNLIS
jgi:hypothetical protein